MRIIALTILLLSFTSTGCVSTANVAVAQARRAQLAGATLTTTQRERADFANMKASNMALGGLGGAIGGAIAGAASVKGGNEQITKNEIPDPAVAIARDLSAHLVTRWSLQPQVGEAVAVNSSDLKELAAAGARANVLLDVQTVNWSTIYLPTKWNRYRVLYNAKLRLIDTRKPEILAEGYFAWKTPDEGPFPTNDELYADNAKILRALLDQAAKAATEYFRTKILGD